MLTEYTDDEEAHPIFLKVLYDDATFLEKL